MKIINGVNVLESDLSGRTVAEVRGMLSQALNIDPTAVATVNGESVRGEYVLQLGDELEFIKPAGTKGR